MLKLALAMLILILTPKISIVYSISMLILGAKISISIANDNFSAPNKPSPKAALCKALQ